jgi:hypothetical protein
MEALIVATLVPGSDPAFIAATLWANVGDYLSPRNFQGETVLIKEVEYVARGCGIETLQSIQFNRIRKMKQSKCLIVTCPCRIAGRYRTCWG